MTNVKAMSHLVDTAGASAPAGNSAPAPKSIDWEAIERDYRTGRYTLRELESRYGPRHSTIAARVRRQGWTRDLASAVRQATSAALLAPIVVQGVSSVVHTVRAAAEVNRQIILTHRSRARRAAEITVGLLEELAKQAALVEHEEIIAQIIAGEGAEGHEVSKARAAVRRALEVDRRAMTVKILTEALAKQISVEREAYSLGTADATQQEAEERRDWRDMTVEQCMEAISSMARSGK